MTYIYELYISIIEQMISNTTSIIMDLLPPVQHTESQLSFGMLTGTPNLFYVPAIDFNDKKINIPFLDPQITIQGLLNEYKINTSCRGYIKGSPNFRIMQGKFKGELALPEDMLMSYDLDLNSICFKLLDSYTSDIPSMSKLTEEFKAKEKGVEIELKIMFQSKSFPLVVSSNEKLLSLRKKIAYMIPQLKQKSLDMINLHHKGFYIKNDQDPLSKFQISSGSVILVRIKKKEGCFHRSTLITMANFQQVDICRIKRGDNVLAYNARTQQFQSDKVTFIKEENVSQCICIQLEGGFVVKTTPNHLFLCEDNIYRRCTAQKNLTQALKEGSVLRLFNGKMAKIQSIYNEAIQVEDQLFYHLSIQNNHNFIANWLITHNMQINVKFPKGQVEPIDVSPLDQILTIKQKIQQLYYIQVHYQKLVYIGKILDNQHTISDDNIPKEATLQLIYAPPSKLNLIKSGTLVLTPGKKLVPVEHLKSGMEIVTVTAHFGKLMEVEDSIQVIQKCVCSNFIIIQIDSFDQSSAITVSDDCYLQCQNGRAYHVMEICALYMKDKPPMIRKINGQLGVIRSVAHYNQKIPVPFYKITTVNVNSSFVVRNLVVHNFVVNIVVTVQGVRVCKVTLAAHPKDTIFSIRKRLGQLYETQPSLATIDVDQLTFHFNEAQLPDDHSLERYLIKVEHVIIAQTKQSFSSIYGHSSKIESSPKKEKLSDKTIIIQVSSTEKYVIRYVEYKEKTVQEIIKEILPNYSSSYFFIYSSIYLFPTDKLSKIETVDFQDYTDNTVLMIKNEKLAFLQKMNIKKEDIKNHAVVPQNQSQVPQQLISSISKISIENEEDFLRNQYVWKATKRIKNDPKIDKGLFKTENFYNPFLYLTSRKYTEKMSKYIKKFEHYKEEYQNPTSVFTIIKDLYLNLQLLPNYYGKCYLAVKNLKFSRYFKTNNTFYFHPFTLAYKKAEHVVDELRGHSGTLFHIRSLNGRQIRQFSLYPQEDEILFMPFTFFLVEGILQKQDYDEVFLVQLSSPISFKKDIILWVDDNPTYNVDQIKKIYTDVENVQVLQLTSTIQALKWIQEFGWLVNWKGLQFKLVSDMTRFEGPEFNKVQNNRAGMDLLIELYNNYGVTARTLVFCTYLQRALQIQKQANISKNYCYQITTNTKKLYQFCKQKNK